MTRITQEQPSKKWRNIHKEMDHEALKISFQDHRAYTLSKDQYTATMNDNFWAMSLAIRDRIVERWIQTQQDYHKNNAKRVYYLSMEFLIGRLFGNYAYNLGLEGEAQACLESLGLSMEDIRDQELDAGLGNGGLGRLAACFLDSMATLGIPAHGYGIRYDYGIFNQKIRDGFQVELPDEWLRLGSPWEFGRLESTVKIRFYGKLESYHDRQGRLRTQWVDTENVMAVPYDIPVPGYRNNIVNTLRLWSARSTEDFDLDYFKKGDYEQAVYQKIYSENISKVLYPNDEITRGKELRLKQEYFFTAASISDILRRYKAENSDLKRLSDKVVIQLNDTHPALAIAELMRVLIDDYDMSWESAWEVTQQTFAYTNHTLMPEALEKWNVDLLERLLPRHLQIIYEINARFLNTVAQQYPGDVARLQRVSLIEEGEVKRVRMAHLAIVGSFSVNGVSKLHSELLKEKILKDFYELYPEKFNNKTNGITQRRWLLKANPGLSNLITENIGELWITRLEHLSKLADLRDDKGFRQQWQTVKRENKQILVDHIERSMNIAVDPDSMFDVQVKRIHEYKRQLMFAFYILYEYLKIKNDPNAFLQPRTFILGGKAAPAYTMAKLHIKFINSIADIVNQDRAVRDRMKVVFLENYRVSLAEKIFPASDLSEQISTAGTEASGTGNMKFMLNGALTIGTYDGANIEMAEALDHEDIFIFGHRAEEIADLGKEGYHPQNWIARSEVLKEIFHLIRSNFFSPNQPNLFAPIYDSAFHKDPFFICADFEAYCHKQDEVSRAYQNSEQWVGHSITNVARAGIFSSDRTIREYAKDIWDVPVTGEK